MVVLPVSYYVEAFLSEATHLLDVLKVLKRDTRAAALLNM